MCVAAGLTDVQPAGLYVVYRVEQVWWLRFDAAAVTGSAVLVPVGALSCRLVSYVISLFCYLLSLSMTSILILRVVLVVLYYLGDGSQVCLNATHQPRCFGTDWCEVYTVTVCVDETLVDCGFCRTRGRECCCLQVGYLQRQEA